MGGGGEDLTDKPDIAESLEGALEGPGKYQKQFSPEVFGRMTQEIKHSHQASGVAASTLFTWPVCQGWGGENRLHPVYAPEPLRQNLPLAGLISGP